MGFGIITQHLSFYKKHKFIQFTDATDRDTVEAIGRHTKKEPFGLFKTGCPLFKAPLKSLFVSAAKAAIELSFSKKLRLSGYFTLPSNAKNAQQPPLTIDTLAPYQNIQAAAIVALDTKYGDGENEPVNVDVDTLDLSGLSAGDLCFIGPEKPFNPGAGRLLVVVFTGEKTVYMKPSSGGLTALDLSKERFEHASLVASSTHPLITL